MYSAPLSIVLFYRDGGSFGHIFFLVWKWMYNFAFRRFYLWLRISTFRGENCSSSRYCWESRLYPPSLFILEGNHHERCEEISNKSLRVRMKKVVNLKRWKEEILGETRFQRVSLERVGKFKEVPWVQKKVRKKNWLGKVAHYFFSTAPHEWETFRRN